MPYELARFGVTDMMGCRGRLRGLFDDDPGSTAGAAQRVVDFFYNELVDERGTPRAHWSAFSRPSVSMLSMPGSRIRAEDSRIGLTRR